MLDDLYCNLSAASNVRESVVGLHLHKNDVHSAHLWENTRLFFGGFQSFFFSLCILFSSQSHFLSRLSLESEPVQAVVLFKELTIHT